MEWKLGDIKLPPPAKVRALLEYVETPESERLESLAAQLLAAANDASHDAAFTDAGKLAQGLDAGVDQALVLLRSTPDLPAYAEQAMALLLALEETCDALLEYFGVTDPDDGPEQAADKAPYGNVEYADPGYQKDGKKRYPVDTEAHVRAAITYISQADNAGEYTAGQLASVKAKIRTAAKKFGIKTSI